VAARIASVDRDFVIAYNQLIDGGYDLPFSQALAYEHKMSSRVNSQVSAESIESKRAGVMERGRTQV